MQPAYEFEIAPDYPVLDAFLNCRKRVSIIRGPLGSGKTVCSAQRLLVQMTEQDTNAEDIRPTRWVAIRNTYSDLAGTTIKDFMEVFDGLGTMVKGGREPPHFTGKFEVEDGTVVETEVIFLALDRPEHVKKLRGYQATGFWLNETKELSKAVVDMADLRHGRYPSKAAGGVLPTWHGMIGDTNSPDEDHWLYELAEEERPEDWEFFVQPGGVIWDKATEQYVPNPDAENLHNLPAGYYIKGMQGKKLDWIKVNLANEYGFVVEGKPVHPQYVDSIHCAKEELVAVKKIEIIVGLDFGRTPAAAIMQKLPIGRWQVIDEFVTEDMSAATFAPELKRYLDANYQGFKLKFWGDPAGDQKGQSTDDTPYKILKDHGIKAKPTKSNAPLERRAALSNPMLRNCMDGKPAFLLSPKCKTIRKGLMGGFCYRRVQATGERYHDEPDKNEYSHPVEAAEYGMQGEGEGRTEPMGGSNRPAPKRYKPRRVQ